MNYPVDIYIMDAGFAVANLGRGMHISLRLSNENTNLKGRRRRISELKPDANEMH